MTMCWRQLLAAHMTIGLSRPDRYTTYTVEAFLNSRHLVPRSPVFRQLHLTMPHPSSPAGLGIRTAVFSTVTG